MGISCWSLKKVTPLSAVGTFVESLGEKREKKGLRFTHSKKRKTKRVFLELFKARRVHKHVTSNEGLWQMNPAKIHAFVLSGSGWLQSEPNPGYPWTIKPSQMLHRGQPQEAAGANSFTYSLSTSVKDKTLSTVTNVSAWPLCWSPQCGEQTRFHSVGAPYQTVWPLWKPGSIILDRQLSLAPDLLKTRTVYDWRSKKMSFSNIGILDFRCYLRRIVFYNV